MSTKNKRTVSQWFDQEIWPWAVRGVGFVIIMLALAGLGKKIEDLAGSVCGCEEQIKANAAQIRWLIDQHEGKPPESTNGAVNDSYLNRANRHRFTFSGALRDDRQNNGNPVGRFCTIGRFAGPKIRRPIRNN